MHALGYAAGHLLVHLGGFMEATLGAQGLRVTQLEQTTPVTHPRHSLEQ